MKNFLISTLIFCALGLAGFWWLFQWHEASYPTAIMEDAYYCYRKQDANCLKNLVNTDAVITHYLEETQANAQKETKTPKNTDMFKQFGNMLSLALLQGMKPMLKITLENALAETVTNQDIQTAVNNVSPWQAKLFTFYPHIKNLDIQTKKLETGIYELTIQREAGTEPLHLQVERRQNRWQVVSLPIDELRKKS